MSQQVILWDSPNAISSPASADGLPHCDSLDGPTTAPCGPAPVRANLSARQAKALGLLTSGTYGPRGSISSTSVALRLSLVSRLKQRLPMAGLTLFKMTWKESTTPLRRSVSLLRASVLRTSGTGCGGWPTPCSQDGPNGGPAQGSDRLPGAACLAHWPTTTTTDAIRKPHPDFTTKNITLNHAATWATLLPASGQTPTGSPAVTAKRDQLNPALSRWLQGYPTTWDDCAPTAMPSCRKSLRKSSAPISTVSPK